MTGAQEATVEVLEQLVGFGSVSGRPTYGSIGYIKDYRAGHGIVSALSFDECGESANIFATIGTDIDGGVVLDDHTDVIGEVLNVIRTLASEHNLTMLMVTHQMGFAREISDRVCFFYEGNIAEQGSPDQIFGNAQNERAKQFLSAVLDAG